MRDDLSVLDATGQAELVRSGACTPLELVDAAIERVESLNPRLNAIIHPLFDKARDQARRDPDMAARPFAGVPMGLKDAVAHSAGDPHHLGMRFLRDLGWTEDDDAWLVTRFRDAGLSIIGKTNVPELAFSDTTEPVAYGPTRNPWDPARSPGGSSGGSAAAVASGMVPVAHGNDMGGSIRIPASACGLVGLKPTRARTSLAPSLGELWGPTTHEGVLTRTVRDTAAVLDRIAGSAPGDPYTAPPPARPFLDELGADPGSLRIGLRVELPAPGGEPHSACRAAVERTGQALEDLGHRVDWSAPDALELSLDDALLMFPVFAARELDRWSARTGRVIGEDDVEPATWVMAEIGRSVTAARYLACLDAAQRWSRQAAAWWAAGWDVLVTPTLPEPPPPLGELTGPTGARLVAYTLPWNLSGQPAISLPLHQDHSGLPIGVQLVAVQGREDLLLRLAAQLEQALPWQDRLPPIHASR
ncbi:amidase [Rhabdothermincola sediminis]|uniref:amidase n=1 Tax=Rhabdothermincola sediminis TaxID=2751370 RepID=UPI0027DA3062|nr:amidase [Rhabdothermincola sediminis]